MSSFLLKRYNVLVNGFAPVTYDVATPSKARAEAFRDYQNYDDQCTFKRFLEISRVLRSQGPDPANYGGEILVDDKPAHYVGMLGAAVKFVRPDTTQVFISHELDVVRLWETKN